MIYSNNEQLVTELKKLLLDTRYSQRDIAKQMGIPPRLFKIYLTKNSSPFFSFALFINSAKSVTHNTLSPSLL